MQGDTDADLTIEPVGNGARSAIKDKKSGTLHRPVANSFRLGYLIHDVSRMRRTVFDQYMKPEGITRSQWWVLANLSRQGGDGLVSAELAKLLDVGKVALGGLIDRLEIAGYIYRRGDKIDRRVKRIHISQAGYQLIERMRVITESLNKRISAGLHADDIALIEKHLIVLKDNLREMLADVGEEREEEI